MTRRMLSVLAGVFLFLFIPTPIASAAPPSGLTECSVELFHGDARLGPQRLPVIGQVGQELHGYHRTSYVKPEQFLAAFYDGAHASWRYPPQDGYVLDPSGNPIRWTQHLMPGARIDRYGSEFGSFLAPEGEPYAERSIPPQSLVGNPAGGCDYRDYLVVRNFTVRAGMIAPWFLQPGGGLQYQLAGTLVPGAPANLNVKWLVDNGYLLRLS